MRGLLLLGVLASCDPAAFGQRAQAIVGGADDPGDPAVVALVIAGGDCSGVVVAPRVVVTAAHCAVPGVGLAQPGTADFAAITPSAQTANIIELWIDRAYTGGVDHDLAAVRLDSDAPQTIAIGAPNAGDPIVLVGYGATDANAATTRGTRRAVAATIAAVTARDFIAGIAGATTCTGDSGGAAIDGGAVVGIISAGGQDCDQPTQLVRPDSEPELVEAIAAWSGPCPADGVCNATCVMPDPDCDPCAFQGTCEPDCPMVDLDCPIGPGPGATCATATDCESRICEPAPEGAARGAFCSASCAIDSDCPPPLGACAAGTCVYAGPTPGIAGATCQTNGDCRGQLCDLGAHVCAVACGADDACPSGLACRPVGDGMACTIASGCAASGNAPGAIAIIVAFAIRRRRRPLVDRAG